MDIISDKPKLIKPLLSDLMDTWSEVKSGGTKMTRKRRINPFS